jgi:hypothetical protein
MVPRIPSRGHIGWSALGHEHDVNMQTVAFEVCTLPQTTAGLPFTAKFVPLPATVTAPPSSVCACRRVARA